MTHNRKIATNNVHAALGAIVGSAAGDALGAPFEFGPSGTYSAMFPLPVFGGLGEMTGGGSFGWAPGEFTDDTQLALAVAESLIASGTAFDPDDMWTRFTAWAKTARDIGITTSAALSSVSHHGAARRAHDHLGRSHSNGSVMRIAPVGVAGAGWTEAETIEVARRQSDLTHFDEAASWSAATAALIIRRLVLGASLEVALTEAFALAPSHYVDELQHLMTTDWASRVSERHSNGKAIVCLAQALWAVRSTDSFYGAVTTAVDLGDDADTVAAVTGAIAGARFGIQAIPSRWSSHLHGWLRQPDGSVRRYEASDLMQIAHCLIGSPVRRFVQRESPVGPRLVDPVGVYAANLMGAAGADEDMAVISLCRGEGLFAGRQYRREIYVIDSTDNVNGRLGDVVEDAVTTIDAFLADGHRVLVHCHGGRSRTGLVLKAWRMRTTGCSHDDAHHWLTQQWPLYDTWNHRLTDFLDDHWQSSCR